MSNMSWHIKTTLYYSVTHDCVTRLCDSAEPSSIYLGAGSEKFVVYDVALSVFCIYYAIAGEGGGGRVWGVCE